MHVHDHFLFAAIEVASGDYGEHWIPILAKATALSSDSDSSGLDNDFSEGNSTNGSDHGGHSYALTSGNSKHNGSNGHDTTVTLLPDTHGGYVPDDETWGPKFWNQFTTLLKRSFLCVSRDMVNCS